MTKTTDAVELLHRRYTRAAERNASLRRERLNANVARLIWDLRVAEQFTQKQLAQLVGTTQSVICRLEDADYGGHSLSMLHRIAEACGRQVELKLVQVKR